MSQHEQDFSGSGFVSGVDLPAKPSTRLAQSASPDLAQNISPNAVKRDGVSARKRFVPVHDLESPQAMRIAGVKDVGGGGVAIADIEAGEFEPGWGIETKPHSQREIFLTKQAFAEGKDEGERETRKIAFEQGIREGRESGYKEGFSAGGKEHKGEVEHRAQEIAKGHNDERIAKIAHFLERLMQVEKEASKRRDTELMMLMIAIFEKTLPALAEANGEQEVHFFLNSILKRFEDIPQIIITLSERSQDLVTHLREQVELVLTSGQSIDKLVAFRFDSSFGKADCSIAWAEGEVERRFSELWSEVKYALQRHLPKTQDAGAQEVNWQEDAKKVTQDSAQGSTQESIRDEVDGSEEDSTMDASERLATDDKANAELVDSANEASEETAEDILEDIPEASTGRTL